MHSDSKLKSLLYRLALVVPDRWFVALKFRKNLGRWPDLRNPKTFNEKLNWLKLHDHNPLYTTMVDKYEAKRYVASIIGEEYIIPTLGVWERAEDIDFDSLPDKFVLKATHDSGRVIICRDKSKLDRAQAVADMRASLKRNFYAVTREWPYKNVKPRIIAETLLETTDGEDLKDYKFFCFNGRVEFMKIDFDRDTFHRANYYDRKFELLDISEKRSCPSDPSRCFERPLQFDLMIRLAEQLAVGIPFLRVDFYNIGESVYWGETTFFPDSGMGQLSPDGVDESLGALVHL